MQVGAVGYPSFVYNTNYVSASSLGRVGAISDDVLSSKIGYTGSAENENPLRPGESKDFIGIIASQMAMSQMNATRIMQSQPEEAQAEELDVQNVAETDIQNMTETDMPDMPEELLQPTGEQDMAWQGQEQQLIGAIEGGLDTAMLGA